MYDKCYFCLDQLPKLKKESTASFFINFGGAGVQKSRPTLLYCSNIIILEHRSPYTEQGRGCYSQQLLFIGQKWEKGDVAYNSLTSSPLRYKSRWSSLIFSSVDLKRSLLCWVSSVNYLTGYRVWKSAVVVVQTLGSEYIDVQRYPLTQM